MAIFDTYPKASFDGIAFPYSKITIRGGARRHVHEFPHSPGGDPEKLGRKLYEIRFRIPAQELPGSTLDAVYKSLYPTKIFSLVTKWEQEITGDLVIPNMGTMRAYAVDWTRDADMAVSTSGEDLDVEFLEDQDKVLAATELAYSPAAMVAANEAFQGLVSEEYKPSIFQKINDAVGEVQGAIGLGDQYSRLAAAKIEQLADLCGQADRELEILQDPMNHPIMQALKDLHANALSLKDTVVSPFSPQIWTFVTPSPMSIGQVSTRIYGTSERAMDLLRMNDIADAFDIKAGTKIRYLTEAA